MKTIWWVIVIAIIAVLVYLGFANKKEEPVTEVPAGASVVETVEGVVDGAAAVVTE